MFNKLIVEKEKGYARINPLAIYVVSSILFILSIFSCYKLYTVEYDSQFGWAVGCLVIAMFEWFTAGTGLFSYFYGRKYGVYKPKKLLIICFTMILLGIVVFGLVQKIAP